MEDLAKIADKAVKQARRELRDTFPDLVDTVLWYGAVDIDPKHLVVWVLLRGPADELPEWFLPSRDPGRDMSEARGPLTELNAAAETVRQAFHDAGWPRDTSVDVGFDSEERVAQSGGWFYFKK